MGKVVERQYTTFVLSVPLLYSDAPFDETGLAASKVGRLRRQIAAQDRELQRQQRARSCHIVQKLVREEWANVKNDALQATLPRGGDDSEREQTSCGACTPVAFIQRT